MEVERNIDIVSTTFPKTSMTPIPAKIPWEYVRGSSRYNSFFDILLFQFSKKVRCEENQEKES